MKAEKAPKLRQSVFVCGLAKLKAKKINTAELSITSVHKPYAESLFVFVILMLMPATMTVMPTMHKKVHEWASQYNQVGQKLPDMLTVLNQQEIGGSGDQP